MRKIFYGEHQTKNPTFWESVHNSICQVEYYSCPRVLNKHLRFLSQIETNCSWPNVWALDFPKTLSGSQMPGKFHLVSCFMLRVLYSSCVNLALGDTFQAAFISNSQPSVFHPTHLKFLLWLENIYFIYLLRSVQWTACHVSPLKGAFQSWVGLSVD